jgi:hypothetical protein
MEDFKKELSHGHAFGCDVYWWKNLSSFSYTNKKLSTNSHIVTTSLRESSKLIVYDLFLSVY